MSQVLRQSTQIKVRIGPAVAVGDGFTPVESLLLSTADEAELLKADGAATVDISGATWAAISGAPAWYDLTLTTSHTDTVGTLDVVVNDDSLILPIFARFQVVEEAAFDAFYAASAAPATAAGVLAVEIDTQDIQSRLPTALVDGKMDSITERVLVHTTINGYTNDADFTLTAGSSDNNAYNGALCIVRDQVTSTQKAQGVVNIYTGATKRVQLIIDPGIFTFASGDFVTIVADRSLKATTPTRRLVVDSNGRADISLIEGVDATDQIDARITAAGLATAAALATAQADLDTLTGSDGATLATSQPNYAPSTAAALATAQADLDTLTGSDGATLATSQPNYAVSTFDVTSDRVLLDKTDAMRVTGSVNDASATTTVFVTNLSEATDDHYIGRTVIFTSGALLGQASDITDYTGSTKTLTVTALTEAPANGVTFEIV